MDAPNSPPVDRKNPFNQRSDVLLVLDINGVLVKKISKHEQGGGWSAAGDVKKHSGKNKRKQSREDVIETKGAVYQVRPGARDFIKHIFEKYHIAIWSSTTYTNISPLIDALFNEDQKHALVFRWIRDRTKWDPEYGTNPEIMDFDTIKPIDEIIQCPTLLRKWKENNILLIDDSKQKLRFNPEKNCLVIPNYNDTNKDFTFQQFLREIEQKVSGLSS